MIFKSINPYSGKELASYTALSRAALDNKIQSASEAYNSWKKTDIQDRTAYLFRLSRLLKDNTNNYAQLITTEMGKPIAESRAEILKCAWLCEYYAANGIDFLADEIIHTDAQKSYVSHQPLGVVLGIMPWNFPFWQVFRFAIPAITAGNTVLLKHAPNVFGCALTIENIFLDAAYPENTFQQLVVHHDEIKHILSHEAVQAVSFTGSEKVGAAVAALAGSQIKKSLLELGGSNAFVVWPDANIYEAVEIAINARMMNSGQSCIAAKRFLLHEKIYEEFVSLFITNIKKLKIGNPLDESTQLGPLARQDLAIKLKQQINDSIKLGAELLYGGSQQDAFHEPAVLGNVRPDMPVFEEETFGPLAAMIKISSIEESIALANKTKYGLGVSIFTSEIEKALAYTKDINDGAFFINELVKSDPRLPFGGTKKSGFGRELSKDGLLEFVNKKTIYIK